LRNGDGLHDQGSVGSHPIWPARSQTGAGSRRRRNSAVAVARRKGAELRRSFSRGR
jgi:hypothetical protein